MKIAVLIIFFIYAPWGLSEPVMPASPVWTWEVVGDGFRSEFIEVIDLNQDGENELMLFQAGYTQGNDNSRVIFLNQNLTTLYCEILVPGYLNDMYEIDLGPLGKELVLATSKVVAKYDPITCQEIDHLDLPSNTVSIAVDDVDLDGQPEVVYSHDSNLYKFTLGDFNNPQMRLGFGGSDIKIMDMGRPGGLDIALYNQTLTLLSGNDLSTINEFFDVMPSAYGIGDTNGDGQFEMIAKNLTNRQNLQAFDIQSGQLVYEFNTTHYLPVKSALDINGDGEDEIVFGHLDVVNYTGQLLFEMQEGTLYGEFVFNDFDGDGTKEFIMNGDNLPLNQDGLIIVSATTGEIEWTSRNFDGPFYLSESFIDDSNGGQQIGVTFFNDMNGYDIGGALLLDSADGDSTEPWQLSGAAWGDVTAVAVGSHTSSSSNMICYSGDDTYDQFIYCADIETGEKVWDREFFQSSVVLMKVIDLDGDQDNELLVLSSSGTMSAYQLENGFLYWQSNNNPNYINQDFNGLHLVGNELWMIANEKITKIDKTSGLTLSSEPTDLTASSYVNGQLFGAIEGQGFGLIDTQDLTMSQLIYPSVNYINYINVSKDGKVAFISTTDNPPKPYNFQVKKQATFVSITNEFLPWEIGEIEMYDSNFLDQFTFFVANSKNVKKYDLRILNEDIFANGFE